MDFNNASYLGIDTSGGGFSYSNTIADTTNGSLGLVKLGDNTLTLSGNNTYSGGTVLYAGTLKVNSNAALGVSSGAVTFNGDATLQAAGSFSLKTSGTPRNISVADNVTATFDTQVYYVTIPGVISGEGAIEKTGTGSLELDGLNTYTAYGMEDPTTPRVRRRHVDRRRHARLRQLPGPGRRR